VSKELRSESRPGKSAQEGTLAVTEVGPRIADAGLQVGDVVLAVDWSQADPDDASGWLLGSG